MIDREKVLVVLRRRFPAARAEDIAAAANAIVGLEPEYEPVACAEVRRLECLAGVHAYNAGDLATGRIRLFRRVE
jgi:hypothetical protein